MPARKKRQKENVGTVTRAFEMPLQGMDVKDPRERKKKWDALRRCWDEAAMLANWCVQTMQRLDVVRTPGMTIEDFPGFPARFKDLNLYAMAFGRDKERSGRKDKTKILPVTVAAYDGSFFEGAKSTATSIISKAREVYAEERYRVLWARSQGAFSTHVSFPWPVPAQAWTEAYLDPGGRPRVKVAFPGGSVTLRLRGGPEFVRQMALFRRVAQETLPRKELVLRWQALGSNSPHKPTCWLNGRPGRVMVKMVADLPVGERPGNRCLVLATDPEAFWVASLDRRRAWVLNNDHFRQGVARHEKHLRRLLRFGQDAKAERRMGSNRAGDMKERLERACLKNDNQLKTWTHQTAAALVNFARRQGVGEVFYLDRDKGFLRSFRWYELCRKLADKLAMNNIDFYVESALSAPGGQEEAPDENEDGGSGEPGINLTSRSEDEKWARVCELRETASRKITTEKKRAGRHPAVVPSGA